MMYIDYERANEIATALRSSGEWNNSDGETFESVSYKAAEILGVDID